MHYVLFSVVADSLTRTQHSSDKELIGQGIGNVMSGPFGGPPGAGATMGTVVNIQAGARTALSGLIRAGNTAGRGSGRAAYSGDTTGRACRYCTQSRYRYYRLGFSKKSPSSPAKKARLSPTA